MNVSDESRLLFKQSAINKDLQEIIDLISLDTSANTTISYI
jgi:hypothetical protein